MVAHLRKANNNSFSNQEPINNIGLGLRHPYIKHIIENSTQIKKDIGWFEIHSENYYGSGGPSINSLIKIRSDFPIALHCVGNSLGSSCGLDFNHLKKLKDLTNIIEPFLISDHISWGKVENNHLNDLLPIPYNNESLNCMCKNISAMQDFLQREILVENPSTYLTFKNDEMSEEEFINKITRKTGCKILLDVNNIFVSANNNPNINAQQYITNIDQNSVAEIHLAGHFRSNIYSPSLDKNILIDTHNDKVLPEVWNLYKLAITKFRNTPTLVEWDQDFPEFDSLIKEARQAKEINSRINDKN